MMPVDLRTSFDTGDKVIIDGDYSIKGIVTAFIFRQVTSGGWHEKVEVSFIHNGVPQSPYIEATRLKKV